jgi:putative addiction module killer protein
MNVEPKKLEYFITQDGNEPVLRWLEALPESKTRAVIKKRLDRAMLGNLGDCGFVGDGILEFKIDYGPGYRIYFTIVKSNIVLLLCGGDKSTQKQDIAKAKEYWADFKQRENVNE